MSLARLARPVAFVLVLPAVALILTSAQASAAAGAPPVRAGGVGVPRVGPPPAVAPVSTPSPVTLPTPVTPPGPVSLTRPVSAQDPLFMRRADMVGYSPNWAGYVASGTRFRFIQATFAVPRLNCRKTPGTPEAPAMFGGWVGLDGIGSLRVTVEQDGIAGQCVRGVPSYGVWWETYPKPPAYLNIAIRPGDLIQASVYYSSAARQYRLTLTNLTNGAGFSTSRRCGGPSCQNATAEVITESPSTSVSGSHYWALADCGTSSFGHIVVTDATGHRGGFASSRWQNTELVMADSAGRVKDATSGLSHGTAFQTYWERAN